jgi:hypothetical protein
MKVFIFGNPDYTPDSLPLEILPELRRRLPDIEFYCLDPQEEWPEMEELTIIDTIINAREPLVFDTLEVFQNAPHLTMHDFDALTNLRLQQKLGRIKKIRLFGLPPNLNQKEAVSWIVNNLKTN